MSATIVQLSPAQMVRARPEIQRVYAAAFGGPPYGRTAADAARFGATLDYHAQRRDFRFLAARDEPDGALLGFAYGYASGQGQWWHDVVSSVMTRDKVARWLDDGYEVVELAVDPPAQGRGLGARLHDALLAGLTMRTAVLSTIAEETVALAMYRQRGWQVLVGSMIFPGTTEPFQILGLDLEARRAVQATAQVRSL